MLILYVETNVYQNYKKCDNECSFLAIFSIKEARYDKIWSELKKSSSNILGLANGVLRGMSRELCLACLSSNHVRKNFRKDAC